MVKHFVTLTNRLSMLREDRGVTSVEYALMVAFIAVVIIVAVTVLGNKLVTVFDNVTNAL